MKYVSSIIALLFVPALAQGATPIEQVTVFADRAEVTRIFRGTCPKDGEALTFERLPAQLDARTLRAEASGRTTVEGLTSRIVPVEESIDARRASLQKELDELTDAMKALQHDLQEISERQSASSGYGGFFRTMVQEELRNPRPVIDRWRSTLRFLATEDLGARRSQVQKNTEARALTRKIEQVARQLSSLQSARVDEARQVTVAIKCGGENQAVVRLSYVVPGATWHPEYDLRFFPASKTGVGKGQVSLTVSAVVQQATGEDWEGVKIVLSTAKPKLGSEAPFPAPLWVWGQEADDAKVMVQGQERRERLQASSGAQAQGPTGAELEDGGKSFTLELPHRATVRADGRPYWMPVDETKGAATVRRIAVPKVSSYVYQALELENPAAYPLMAGRVHAFRRNAFMGSTTLEYTGPGAPMEVSLGIDGSFKVERVVQHQQDRKPTLLDGKRRFERHYRIRVHNQTRSRARVQVRENVPVSKDENIGVELDRKKTTRGIMLDEHRGMVSFDVDVASGSDEAVDLAYTISLPKDWQVQ